MRKLIILLILISAFAACKKKNKSSISVSSSNIEITDKTPSVTISIDASDNWYADYSNRLWFKLTPVSGAAGSSSMTISMSDGAGFEDRSASFILYCGSTSTKINVTNRATDGVQLNTREISVAGSGGAFSAELKSNEAYSVTIPVGSEWISKSRSKAITDYTENFNALPNPSVSARKGYVIFKSASRSDTLTVNQAVNIYTSSDYSQDGKVTVLQKATRGRGVDVVFVGDGFTDRLTDEYTSVANRAFAHFFSAEPVKSYREYFNVYSVKAVSKNEEFSAGSKTALSVKFGAGTLIKGDESACEYYARKAPLANINNVLIIICINSTRWAGTCYMYSTGISFAYVPLAGKDSEFKSLILHEGIGHGLGRLYDEYISYNRAINDNEQKSLADQYKNFGWWSNIDFTADAATVKWKDFIGHAKYPYVGTHEGANYKKGIWRAEPYSCMDDNRSYFNAPSREALVYSIRTIAGETYSWNDFVAKDKYEPVTKASYSDKPRLHPPIAVVK